MLSTLTYTDQPYFLNTLSRGRQSARVFAYEKETSAKNLRPKDITVIAYYAGSGYVNLTLKLVKNWGLFHVFPAYNKNEVLTVVEIPSNIFVREAKDDDDVCHFKFWLIMIFISTRK